MNTTTRRTFVKRAAAVAGGNWTADLYGGALTRSASTNKSGVRIERISYGYEEHIFRAPLKFALTVVDRQTVLTVKCTVRRVRSQKGVTQKGALVRISELAEAKQRG